MTIPTHKLHRNLTVLLLSGFSLAATAQMKNPDTIEQSKENLRLWLETSQKNQAEANAWKIDKEVFENYKQGLESEKATYQKQVEDAKARAAAADKESSEKIAQRDQFIAADKMLSSELRKMEEDFSKLIPLLPTPIVKFSKMNVALETLKKNLSLPLDQQVDDTGKRLANLTEIMAEVEKFQNTVTVYTELHKNASGEEYEMQVAYMGMAAAYAVNENASFALIGRPTADGWKFTERNDVAADIQKFLVTATSEKDVSLTKLPIPTAP